MTFSYENFYIAFLITMIPVFIIKYKGWNLSTKRKRIVYSILWMIISLLLSGALLYLIKEKIYFETLISTCIGFSFVNYCILDDKINLKKAVLTLLVFLGFFLSSYFQIIPIRLFGITKNNYTVNTQVCLTLFSDTCFLAILVFIYFKDLKKDFKVFKKKYNELLDSSFKYYFIGLVVMVLSNILINNITPSNMPTNEESVQGMIKASPYLTLICTGILAPFIEELIFRKSFKDAFNSKLLFIFVSSLVFGGLHVVISMKEAYELLYLLPYCSLAFPFAIIYTKSDNIFTTITLHSLHNTVITIVSIISNMVIL